MCLLFRKALQAVSVQHLQSSLKERFIFLDFLSEPSLWFTFVWRHASRKLSRKCPRGTFSHFMWSGQKLKASSVRGLERCEPFKALPFQWIVLLKLSFFCSNGVHSKVPFEECAVIYWMKRPVICINWRSKSFIKYFDFEEVCQSEVELSKQSSCFRKNSPLSSLFTLNCILL